MASIHTAFVKKFFDKEIKDTDFINSFYDDDELINALVDIALTEVKNEASQASSLNRERLFKPFIPFKRPPWNDEIKTKLEPEKGMHIRHKIRNATLHRALAMDTYVLTLDGFNRDKLFKRYKEMAKELRVKYTSKYTRETTNFTIVRDAIYQKLYLNLNNLWKGAGFENVARGALADPAMNAAAVILDTIDTGKQLTVAMIEKELQNTVIKGLNKALKRIEQDSIWQKYYEHAEKYEKSVKSNLDTMLQKWRQSYGDKPLSSEAKREIAGNIVDWSDKFSLDMPVETLISPPDRERDRVLENVDEQLNNFLSNPNPSALTNIFKLFLNPSSNSNKNLRSNTDKIELKASSENLGQRFSDDNIAQLAEAIKSERDSNSSLMRYNGRQFKFEPKGQNQAEKELDIGYADMTRVISALANRLQGGLDAAMLAVDMDWPAFEQIQNLLPYFHTFKSEDLNVQTDSRNKKTKSRRRPITINPLDNNVNLIIHAYQDNHRFYYNKSQKSIRVTPADIRFNLKNLDENMMQQVLRKLSSRSNFDNIIDQFAFDASSKQDFMNLIKQIKAERHSSSVQSHQQVPNTNMPWVGSTLRDIEDGDSKHGPIRAAIMSRISPSADQVNSSNIVGNDSRNMNDNQIHNPKRRTYIRKQRHLYQQQGNININRNKK